MDPHGDPHRNPVRVWDGYENGNSTPTATLILNTDLIIETLLISCRGSGICNILYILRTLLYNYKQALVCISQFLVLLHVLINMRNYDIRK